MNPQVEAEAREAFEAYIRSLDHKKDDPLERDGDGYKRWNVHLCWGYWQAALNYAASQVPKDVGEVVWEGEASVVYPYDGPDAGYALLTPHMPTDCNPWNRLYDDGELYEITIRKPVQAVEGERK